MPWYNLKRVRTLGGWRYELVLIERKRPLVEGVVCKRCGAEDIVRFGSYKGVQRYRCKVCGVTFMDKDTLPHMQMTIPLIADAVSLFYEGLSLNAIRRQLRQTYGIYPSDSNVYAWIVRFTQSAIRAAEGLQAHVGSTWVADETVLKVGGSNTWFWDCIDSDSRFLLASHLSENRRTRDAQVLMERALERAGRPPKIILTDKLRSYLDGIELTFGADTRHIQSGPFKLEKSTRDIERFHGTLKDRTKVMRGMQNRQTARLRWTPLLGQ